ncbi:hypothetical protein [uncultured Oscillibacter sp.]|uniref:hypothetical protein n=2 Tax=uncultured Oscillibacter sp. TaxID=876091 RepID=UPI00280618EB|nr:hypothetical protein [uncultured Oscillibacter sp.]
MKHVFRRGFPLLLCLLLTAGCGRAADPPPAPEPDAPPAETLPPAEKAADPRDMEIVLPEEYQELLLVTTDFPDGGANPHWVQLLLVQEKASVEAARADGFSGEGDGVLFGISALDQTAFEQLCQGDGSGCEVFARDESWYYARTFPTDVRFYRSGGTVDTQTEDWKTWERLSALGPQVSADIIQRNGLTPYSLQEFWNQPFTWEGDHAYVKYFRYFTFDGSKREYETLVLSQPARQGEGGIWCVERVYDEYGTVSLTIPAIDQPMADHYAALQAECDAGQHPELLTPLGAARAYILTPGYYNAPPAEESLELTDGPDGGYMETNRRMHELLSDLFFDRAVDGRELLDCAGSFTYDTWGVMGRRNYGSDWWTPLKKALAEAAVGPDQADRDRDMMNFYLSAYDPYAEAVAGMLQAQRAADAETFDRVLGEFDGGQQALLREALG